MIPRCFSMMVKQIFWTSQLCISALLCCPYCSFQFISISLCAISQHICRNVLCHTLIKSLITLSLKDHRVFHRYAFVPSKTTIMELQEYDESQCPSSTNKMLTHKSSNAPYFCSGQSVHLPQTIFTLSLLAVLWPVIWFHKRMSDRTQTEWLHSIQRQTDKNYFLRNALFECKG